MYTYYLLFLLLWIPHLLLSLLPSLSILLSDINIRWTNDLFLLIYASVAESDNIYLHFVRYLGVYHITHFIVHIAAMLFDSEPTKLPWLHYIRMYQQKQFVAHIEFITRIKTCSTVPLILYSICFLIERRKAMSNTISYESLVHSCGMPTCIRI